MPPATGFDEAHIHTATCRFEGTSGPLQCLPVAQARAPQAVLPDVVQVLSRREQFEELDRACRPARDVARELLEHQCGALAPAQRNRMDDFGAWAGHVGHHTVQGAVSDQVADVRRDPLGTCLDEQIVIELFEVRLHCAELLAEDGQQRRQRAGHGALAQLVELVLLERAQHLAGVDLGLQLDVDLAVVGVEPAGSDRCCGVVAAAQDHRKQLEKPLHVGAHDITPSVNDSGPLSSVSSSAGLTLPSLCTAGSAAINRGCGCGEIGPVSMR